jgi:hypothetical protein
MVVLAAGLAALVTHHVLQADGFFLDDWLYTQTSEFIGQHAPGAAWGDIPNWTRGAQRLYPIVLAPVWGSLDASPAYAVSHLVNVALLTSSVVPAALLARRFVDGALLRVLAVALAVVLPPLTIGATLLTENLAMPLLLWAVYLITRTAERPTLLNQIAALACIGALTLTRLNLAATFGALVVTVAVAELLELRDARGSRRAWLRAALRRRAALLAATVAVVAAAVWTLRSGGPGGLGVYADGGAQSGQLRAMWTERDAVIGAIATYARSMVVGAFVFPFALGLAGAVAALRGTMGRRAVLAGVAAVSCFAISLLVVSAYTRNGPFEERYAFYFYPPIALFAVAAVQHLRRIPIELIVASGVTLWALDRGAVRPSGVHFHYFSWPAEAFWDRVVEHRLVRLEGSLPGWLPASQSGWQLIALGLILLLAVALAARFAPARIARVPLAGLLSAGLLVCVVAQALALNYAFGALMHGFPEQPGGYAGAPGHAADRRAWIDEGLPDGAQSALLAPMPRPGAPFGGAEAAQYWNRSLDAVVALRFSDAPIAAGAGLYTVESTLTNSTPVWSTPLDLDWLVTDKDEPRVQYAGAVTAAPGAPEYSFVKLEKPVRGVWAVTGIEPDGYVPAKGYATMALSRRPGDGVRGVQLSIRGADALPGPAGFRVTLDGADTAITGRVRPGRVTKVTLSPPRCDTACPPVIWRLVPSGRPAMVTLPIFGQPPPPRPVQLQLAGVRVLRG